MAFVSIPPIKMRTSRGYTVNENSFSYITPESSYWIGMLITDGNIFENRVNLTASEKDSGHINKFRDFLKSNNNIERKNPDNSGKKIKSKPHFRLQFRCNKIVSDLAKFGVVPKKSHTAMVTGLEENRDFWRGVIDGDGCLYVRKTGSNMGYICISLVGSKFLLEQFRDFVSLYCPNSKANVLKCKNKNLHLIQVCGKSAEVMIGVLYKDACVSIDRKYEIAEKIMNKHQRSP